MGGGVAAARGRTASALQRHQIQEFQVRETAGHQCSLEGRTGQLLRVEDCDLLVKAASGNLPPPYM
jgi:hypothetical protein